MGQSVVQVTLSWPTDFTYFSFLFLYRVAFFVVIALSTFRTQQLSQQTLLLLLLHLIMSCMRVRRRRGAWQFAPRSGLSSAGGKLTLSCLHFVFAPVLPSILFLSFAVTFTFHMGFQKRGGGGGGRGGGVASLKPNTMDRIVCSFIC